MERENSLNHRLHKFIQPIKDVVRKMRTKRINKLVALWNNIVLLSEGHGDHMPSYSCILPIIS